LRNKEQRSPCDSAGFRPGFCYHRLIAIACELAHATVTRVNRIDVSPKFYSRIRPDF